jgi:protein-disulfide isomerase
MRKDSPPIVLASPVSGRDHLWGPIDAPVILVEYGDYECADCNDACRMIREIKQEMQDRLCFVFRHFPLSSLHPHSLRAAEAAVCAAQQGLFWQMHDLLFARQDALENGAIVEYAVQIGLNIPPFLRELSEHRHDARVREDIESGRKSGVHRTPTFFINGIRYDTPVDRITFQADLAKALRNSEGGKRL